jgi:hypothetical protein
MPAIAAELSVFLRPTGSGNFPDLQWQLPRPVFVTRDDLALPRRAVVPDQDHRCRVRGSTLFTVV